MRTVRVHIAVVIAVMITVTTWLAARQSQADTGHETHELSPLVQHVDVQARLSVFDAWTAHRVADREQPGLSIGIIHDGKLLWMKSYGFADLEKRIPATASTIYRIGSISKVFTAIAVMQLRDAGLLRLDNPVEQYLNWFQVRNPFSGTRAITIRDLLTHTSGLPFDAPGVNWNEYSGPSRQEIKDRTPGVEMIFPAGEQEYYSNYGFWIAGQLVATVSGQPYTAYVEEHILAPLGMTDTNMEPTAAAADFAIGYKPRRPGQPREAWHFTNTEFYTPAGDGASSLEDMAKLVALFMSDSASGAARVLKLSTMQEMWGHEQFERDGVSPRGLGLGTGVGGGEIRVQNSGDGGGFVASYGVTPADKFGVVVLTNSDDAAAWTYRDLAFQIVGSGVREALASADRPRTDNREWTQYIGSYRWDHWKVNFLVVGGQLSMFDPGEEHPWESLIELKPEGAHTFRMLEVDSQYGELMYFVVSENGNVVAAQFPSWQALRE